ncbi:adenylate/guanylate cyclase domain-containing protein [Clostridium sp.]|uniref:adenylate/guanylate cyclase domain-containing protein n=1 Tax=Clostridium sp. TaxID=1506 RepID=UPI00260CF882|nr:adenylate/guanylate cyclase domain-containing protein [Clostridium sp.]
MLSKSDFDKLDERLKNITSQSVEQIEVNSDLPPTLEQLEDNNKTYSIMAAILFIDIRKSTYLTENSQAKSMVKIYRSFMRMAVECVRKNSGVTRQFLGDRIMGVFIDSLGDDGTVIEKAVDKAINAARSLLTVTNFSLNKHLKNNVNGKIIECGIGIDYGKVLVTQVGMYGVEGDDNKENEVNCVWVGNTTNYASKYSDIASGGEIFISSNVYKTLSEDYKSTWTESAKYKGKKLYQGYVVTDYYLDFVEELGNPIKIEEDNAVNLDTSEQLADGIKEIQKLQDKLIQKEKELAVLEDRLKRENQDLRNQCAIAKKEKSIADSNAKDAIEILKQERIKFYDYLFSIIKANYLNDDYISKLGKELWGMIINEYFAIGKKLEYSNDEITRRADCYLINIYNVLGMYEKAYSIMLIMARINMYWVNMEDKTLQWAKTQYRLGEVENEINKHLVNYTIAYDRRKDFEGYIDKIKKIRGF